MATITVIRDEHVFRWAGGSFIPVWTAERADEHVPDAMITVPDSLNRARAGRVEIERIAADYLAQAHR